MAKSLKAVLNVNLKKIQTLLLDAIFDTHADEAASTSLSHNKDV